MSMITDRIGRHKVLLPINHNCYNFRKQQIHLGQICAVSLKGLPQNSKRQSSFRFGFIRGEIDHPLPGFSWFSLRKSPQNYGVTYRSKFSLGIFPIEKLIFVSEIN